MDKSSQFGHKGPYVVGPGPGPVLPMGPGMPGPSAPPPHFGVPPTPMVPSPPANEGWFARSQRNKPQSNSSGAGALTLISGGMNLSWSFNINTFAGVNAATQMRSSWFIAAAVGALVSAILVDKIHRKMILMFSALLVTIGGIIFMSAPNNFDAIMAARWMDGLATGMTIVPSLMLIGEQSVKSMRGMNAGSLDVMCFSLGIYIEMVYRSTWSNSMTASFNARQMHGALMILFGVLGEVIILMLLVDSPVHLLTQNREQEALDALRRLQRPFIITTETYEQLLEHKDYVAENNAMSPGDAAVAGLPALLKLCFYRSMIALSYSNLMHLALVTTSVVLLAGNNLNNLWPMILFGTFRWLGAMLGAFVLDTAGRRVPLIVGSMICGGMAIGVGVSFKSFLTLYNSMWTVLVLLIVYQMFAGVSLVSCSAYLTEAFPLAVKPYYIAAAFIVEMIVQIIISAASNGNALISDYFYALAAMSFVLALLGAVCLPETKYTSLREAQHRLRKILSIKLN